MAALVVVTEDDAFADAIKALACDGLSVACVHLEEAVAAIRHDHPNILAVDIDSIRDSRSLIGALSLLTQARVVAIGHQAWPGTRTAADCRTAGADMVLPKPSGRASPSLAGRDRDDYRRWLSAIAGGAHDDIEAAR